MSKDSSIEWTESTWNPVTGCTKISDGCKNCYAERMAKRLKSMGHPNYINEFSVTCHEHVLDLPLGWRKPKMVFANSMSDLFHRDVPSSFIEKVFQTMNNAPWHCFQVLTKRAERMLKIAGGLNWTANIWLGVTVENEKYVDRILELQATPAVVKFLSLEPLLGPMPNIPLKGIGWVIVGGESGPGARRMKKNWVAEIRDQCLAENVPFFFKQWGGVNKKKSGRLLDNRLWNQMPVMDGGIAEQRSFNLMSSGRP